MPPESVLVRTRISMIKSAGESKIIDLSEKFLSIDENLPRSIRNNFFGDRS
jgi:hypothetical protein